MFYAPLGKGIRKGALLQLKRYIHRDSNDRRTPAKIYAHFERDRPFLETGIKYANRDAFISLNNLSFS